MKKKICIYVCGGAIQEIRSNDTTIEVVIYDADGQEDIEVDIAKEYKKDTVGMKVIG